jgi:hypothetical protein
MTRNGSATEIVESPPLPSARGEFYDAAVARGRRLALRSRHILSSGPGDKQGRLQRRVAEPEDVAARPRLRGLVATVLLVVLLAAPSAPPAQPRSAEETERERELVEALRREDPAEADRYVALSDARAQAIAELRRVEAQYQGAGPELRAVFIAPLRSAQRKYAETSLALLDFFDARERRAIARYQEEIQRINALLEDRQRARAELQKLLGH